MPIIIGIDPGSRLTGYGVIHAEGGQHSYLTSGCIRTSSSDHAQRLRQIFSGITTVIQDYRAEEAAVEQVFMHVNPASALKLGQARGAAIVAVSQLALSVAEYSARQIKQSVVGYGAAQRSRYNTW